MYKITKENAHTFPSSLIGSRFGVGSTLVVVFEVIIGSLIISVSLWLDKVLILTSFGISCTMFALERVFFLLAEHIRAVTLPLESDIQVRGKVRFQILLDCGALKVISLFIAV